MARDWPSVSVVMPVRDEAANLREAAETVLAQNYPGRLELVLAVAPSRDDSDLIADLLVADDSRVRVVPNPDGTTPSGLNRAIEAATGEVIARVDAHAQLTPGYLAAAVELLEVTGAANVGGVQRAVGSGPMQRAIARAMSSRFGTGDARFHYGGEAGPSDSVYLGVFRSEILRELGGFDERLLRNQDYELNVRIRNHGAIVWFDPRLEVIYRPRTNLSGLATQYWQYGRWKRVTLRQHPGSLRWRQLVPPVTVVANVVGFAAATLTPWTLVVPGTYAISVLLTSAIAGRQDPAVMLRLPAVFAILHHAWGAGFLAGPPAAAR